MDEIFFLKMILPLYISKKLIYRNIKNRDEYLF